MTADMATNTFATIGGGASEAYFGHGDSRAYHSLAMRPRGGASELYVDQLDQALFGKTVNAAETGRQRLPIEADDQAQQAMFRDIDAILARLEDGIAVQRNEMDALLARLSSKGQR